MGGAYERGGPRRVALLGRPERRQVLAAQQARRRTSASSSTTSPAPPATRSTSWSSSAAATWRFVDTAGIRRRVHQTRGADFYASLRTQTALEKAEVAVVLVDASGDALRAGHPRHPAGRRRRPRPGHRLQQVGPHSTRSAATTSSARSSATSCRCRGRRGSTSRRAPAGTWTSSCRRSTPRSTSWDTRIPTGRLNAFLGELVAGAPAPGARRQAAPHPVRDPGRRPGRRGSCCSRRASSRPGYRRFVERRLREEFGFVGTPIEISVRGAREAQAAAD